MSQTSNIYNLAQTNTYVSPSVGGGGGIITPIPPLSTVLAAGNNTGTTDIVVADDVSIIYQGGIQITNNNATPAISSANTGISLGSATTVASTPNSIAIGNGAQGNYDNSVAIGTGVITTQVGQILLGDSTQQVQVPGDLYTEKSIVFEGGIQISNNGSFPGVSSSSTGIAIGNSGTLASATGSLAIGNGAIVNHNNSTAIGQGAQTTDNDQIMMGQNYQLVQVPGTLYAEQWQGGIGRYRGNQTVGGTGALVTLAFDEVDYANDVTGFSPVSNPSIGHIRLMRPNSMYNINCSMRVFTNGTAGGVYTVALTHKTYVSSVLTSSRVIGVRNTLLEEGDYVSLAGTVLSDSDVDQFIDVTVENLSNSDSIIVAGYYAAAIRFN